MSDNQHASPIKTPRQLITVVALAFVVPVVVIMLLATYAAGGSSEADGAAQQADAVAKRLAPVGQLDVAAADGAKTLQSGEAVYNASCVGCHGAGIAGAPKVGDAGVWAPRVAQGFDALVKHATDGFKAMPPKGGNSSLDKIEVARAVAFMGNKSGGKFKEPEAAAK